ncbi:MAG: phage tail sheath subtilisin-like domain-containing protein, partial [Betaproteobacteria bacterium]|nr:phage tail sheath subtilisin-like domain-containing protein [Betaproteobacteria bacterium]
FYAEVSNSAANSATANQRALIIGQITAAGIAPVNVPLISQGAADAVTQGGIGSMLALMTAAYRNNDSFGEVWYLPLADDPAAIAATGKVTIANAPTATGTLYLYIAGQRVALAVSATQTPAQISTALAAAINAIGSLPVTAVVNSTNTAEVDITAKNKGENGNQIDLRLNYLGKPGGELLPTGLGITITAMTGGATNPDLTAALANLGSEPFDFIACPYTDTASINVIKTLLNDQTGRWSWDQKVYGHSFGAYQGTMSDQTTFGTSRNNQHETFMAVYDSPTPSWIVAAALTGASAVSLRADPGMPVHTVPLLGVLAPPIQSRFSLSERNTLLFDGMSTFTVAQDGTVAIEGLITTYQTNAFGQPDNSYLKVNTLFLLMYVLRALEGRITSTYARMKLADDGTRFAPGSAIVTPNIVRADLIAQYSELEYQGYVQNADAFKAELIVQRNGTDPNRLDVLYPGILINQLDVLALLFQFRLT